MWGQRFLMCPPDHFEVAYEINPWMHTEVAVDGDLARAQWERLVSALTEAGAVIEWLSPVRGLPDLVFTANAGLVDGHVYVPARFKNPERQPETEHDTAWFLDHQFTVKPLPEGLVLEGAGDALPFAARGRPPVLVAGYRIRSDVRAHAVVSRLLGVAVRSVELVDPRLYHLDLAFCPLDARRALVVWAAFDHYGRKVVADLVPEPIELLPEEAFAFVGNSVVVGDVIIMPTCPVRVGRLLEGAGFSIEVCDVSEFIKAGGACRCLTLALDVRLSLG
ncbi:MAG: hypothetical protein N2037_05340 [Acidimicrobiales bacterium]|nr:hypothetical protein [Acidimicrobiales bacterium]